MSKLESATRLGQSKVLAQMRGELTNKIALSHRFISALSQSMSALVTRFAPSPTGGLHLGHAYSALCAYEMARGHQGRFLLRIEDIDPTRCTREKADQILVDLAWLGLHWEQPVRYQSEHREDYTAAAERLRQLGVLYPCFCTRSDIQREIAQAGHAPHGSEGPIYPGTCRGLPVGEQAARIADGQPYALRLDVEKTLAITGHDLTWHDESRGTQAVNLAGIGDAVIVRKDIGTSYHLSVVVDDALQGITDIVRGEDLFEATHIHRVLQALLELPSPRYHHHALQTDENGVRLAKRNQAITLRSLRENGLNAAELRGQLGFTEGDLWKPH